MMNFGIKLRKQPSFCDPVGPSFNNAKLWEFTIAGTKIEFRTPRHQPMIKSRKAIYPESNYQNNDLFFRSMYRESRHTKDEWESTTLFNHDWAFNGPWFTGCLAHLPMALIIIRRKEANKNMSLFHPRAFEQTIGDFLTNQYSKLKFEGKHEYIAPVDWSPFTNLPVIAARLKAIKNEEVASYDHDEYLFFPIDNNHIMYFIFSPHLQTSGTKSEINQKIGDRNINDLIDNIINSLNISLSPDAITQQTKALKELDDTSLIKEFLPMKWSKSIIINSEKPYLRVHN